VNDLQITAQVKSKLASDLSLSSVTNISVNSTNGVVTLSGQVDSADLKARAETLAKSVPKVARVVNSIQIAPKTGGIQCCGPSQHNASIAIARKVFKGVHLHYRLSHRRPVLLGNGGKSMINICV
jgi:uncharacterized protein with PhoU and TrkA domain